MQTNYLIGVVLFALFVVLAILGAGVYAMMRGGKFGERWSNKLMQYRVMAQAAAIVLILIIAFVVSRHGS